MWTCSKCGRIFNKKGQPHSCRKVAIDTHFKNRARAKGLFDKLVDQINSKVGKIQTISLPCCIHLFGKYDFLAALPKKDRLEIRFSLDRILDSPRLTQSVPMSAKVYKNCIDIRDAGEIDQELLGWLNQAHHLKG